MEQSGLSIGLLRTGLCMGDTASHYVILQTLSSSVPLPRIASLELLLVKDISDEYDTQIYLKGSERREQ